MIYMFCYDISHPKRLRKAAKELEKHGIRVQKSFFQCEMNIEQKETLKRALLKIINRKQDSLFIYPLCNRCSRNAITSGVGEVIKISSFQIV